MNISEYIKYNFLSFVVLVVLVILLLKQCGGAPVPPAPTIKRDTVWVHNQRLVTIPSPQLIKTVPVEIITKEYLPDTNYAVLIAQYSALVEKFLASNIYKDKIQIDSIGHIFITDTVSNNLLIGKSVIWDIKYPVITNVVTLKAPLHNQIYVGGGIGASQGAIVNQINAGALFKNKKDQIFGVSAGINSQGNTQYGVNFYYKISLRKK